MSTKNTGVQFWARILACPAGARILTLGTGGVSIFATQFGQLAGFQVIGTSSGDDKLKRLHSLGVLTTINYKKTPDWQIEVNRITNGLGVDQVIEVGGAGTLLKSIDAVKTSGMISLIGVLTGVSGEINPWMIVKKSLRVQGTFVGSTEMFENMNRFIEKHRMHPVIDEVFSFTDAKKALSKLESGSHFGKIVIQL